jgi:hypothetical protein
MAPLHIAHLKASVGCCVVVSAIGREIMLSVRGIYENGKVILLEPILSKKRAKVIVTVLEEVDINIFDDLVGVVGAREDGSIKHDQYITSPVR